MGAVFDEGQQVFLQGWRSLSTVRGRRDCSTNPLAGVALSR
jgi:hypothetical protein